MSYKAIAWAYDLPLKGPCKPVLNALADHADEAGSCYPGQEKLAAMSGMSLRTVRRALERLERLGLISRERRFDAYGHRTSDRYYLQLDVQSLPATLTSGHTDLRSESPSLPVTLSIPTGHSDRVTISRTTREPSGGPQTTPPTPGPVDNSNDEPSPWCRKHTASEGIDGPCLGCKRARHRYDAWAATHPVAAPAVASKPVLHMLGLCDAHRQREDDCDMCEREGIGKWATA